MELLTLNFFLGKRIVKNKEKRNLKKKLMISNLIGLA